MPLFKFRKGGEEPVATPQPESVEAMRRRARHRLIGASVLVLLGVVGFPLLFDTQPRPIAVDIPIEIPDRNKAKPLPVPARPLPKAPVAAGPVASAPSLPKAEEKAAAPASAPVAQAPAEPKPQPEPVARAESKPETKPEPKPEPKVAVKPDESARAQALLEGKPVKTGAEAPGRFVVQVGAFSDNAKAREARRKLERAGLKTYAQSVETKDGKRIRVRVGPFANRSEADKAADKVKGLDLPAAILSL